ncbi:MAG: LEA type 2 family protein [Candidatus Cyclobacteriaceae bacterium M2_1C_046]
MLKWIVGGAAAFFTGRYLLRLNKASETVVTRTSLQVNKVSLSGIELKAGVRLQNPNSINLSIQYPFVNLTYKDASLGSSQVKDETILIPANGEQSFTITIQSAGWLSLIQVLGTELTQKIRSGQKAVLDVVSTVTTKVNGIPYSQQETLKLTI